MTPEDFDVAALPRLKFASRLVEPVLDGHKTATVRHVDAGAGIEPGDRFVAADPDGEPFAVVTAEAVAECAIRHVPGVLTTFGARYGHATAGAIVTALEEHYGRGFTRETPVRTVVWDRGGLDDA